MKIGEKGNTMGLTVKQIEGLKESGRYLDERGLYLQVMSATNRSWLLRYEIKGRKRWMGLGPFPDFTLPEARERARQARQFSGEQIALFDDVEALARLGWPDCPCRWRQGAACC